MTIVQGDNGYTVPFNTFMDLTDATVNVVVQRGTDLLNKTANIIDVVNGKCELPLLSSDLTIAGIYRYQWTVSYSDGRIKSGKQNDFYVYERLVVTTPAPADTTPPVITIYPSGGNYTANQTITLSSNETANIYYTVDGTTPTVSSTRYSAPFTVSSTTTVKYFGVDSAGNASSVQNAVYTINVAVVDTTPPNPVTNLVVGTPTTTTIPLTWTLSTSNDVANYEVAYSTNGIDFTVASNQINSSSNSYTTNGLSSSTNYTLRVVAIDTSGNRSTGVTVTATTSTPIDTTPPNEVTNLATSNVTDKTLTLTWTASTSSDIASYDVYQGATLLGNTTNSTYNVSSLSASTQYTFKIVSKDTNGNVSTGTSITITTNNSAPTTAIVGSAIVGSSTIS